MGCLVMWADSKATEGPESRGIRRLPYLICVFFSLPRALGALMFDVYEGERTGVTAISQVLGTQSPKLISKQEDQLWQAGQGGEG